MPLAVITGASSGLGAAFAHKLAARGYDLLLVARRAARLEEIEQELEARYKIAVECFPADLACAEDCSRVATRLASETSLDFLVNNAGFGTIGAFTETDFQRQLDMVSVHVLAIMRLTRAALPGMIERRSGAIINVSSVAGFWRSSGSASYSATKGWINDFTEALRIELDSITSPVQVQALCPGFTYTEFHDTLGVDRATIPRVLWMSADFVVEASLNGLASRRLFVIPGWKYRLGVALGALLPVSWRLALERASPHKRVLPRAKD